MQYLLFFNLLKIRTFVAMTDRFVNIHTHRPTGRGIELRTAGIHPWNADKEDVSTIVPVARRGAGGRRNGTRFRARRRPCGTAGGVQGAARAGARTANARGAALRQGFRAGHARTGRLPAPRGDFSRLHRIARTGPRASEKVITFRSVCAPSHRPRRWNPCAKRPSRSFFSKPTTATSRSRRSTRAPRR